MKGVLLMLVALIAIGSTAQEMPPNKSDFAIGVQISPSVRFLTNNKGINTSLKNAGLPALPNQLFLSEIGVSLWVNRLYLTVTGREYSLSKTTGDRIVNGEGMGGEVRVHYNLLQPSGKFFFGPYLGLGGDSFNYKFDRTSQRTFSDALMQPSISESVRFSITDQFVLSGGFIFLTKTKQFNNWMRMASGFQAGYLWATQGSYRVNNELVTRPSSSFSGVDAKAIIIFSIVVPKRS